MQTHTHLDKYAHTREFDDEYSTVAFCKTQL